MVFTRSYLIFGLCAVYSLIGALYPFEFSGRTLHLDREMRWNLLPLIAVGWRDSSFGDFLRNVFYFLPWGGLVYILGQARSRKGCLVLKAALIGAIVSISIELSQIVFAKQPSIFDVFANTFGALLGAMLCAFSPINVRRLLGRCLGVADHWQFLLPAALFLGLIPLLISVSRFSGLGLKLWNRHYTFNLGKAASSEMPWLGEAHRIAVYDRALAPEAIAHYHQLSRSDDVVLHRTNSGRVAICTFGDSPGIEDNSELYCGPPRNFALILTSNFRWLQGRNGIDTLKPSVLKTERSAEKLFDAIRGRSELTLETWMAPSKIERNERSHVVSFARKTLAGDFTPDPESDGRALTAQMINMRSGNEFRAPEQFHLVVTYKRGFHELFVNGRKYPYKNFDLRLADFIVSFGNNPFAQIAYSFVYFFPVSFLFSRVLSNGATAYSATLIAGMGALILLSLSELVQAYLFGRTIDWVFLVYGFSVVLAGALSGVFLAQETRSPKPNP